MYKQKAESKKKNKMKESTSKLLAETKGKNKMKESTSKLPCTCFTHYVTHRKMIYKYIEPALENFGQPQTMGLKPVTKWNIKNEKEYTIYLSVLLRLVDDKNAVLPFVDVLGLLQPWDTYLPLFTSYCVSILCQGYFWHLQFLCYLYI